MVIVVAALSLFGSSLKQELETDPAKWAMFAFPRPEFELTVRLPDEYIPLETQGSALGPLAADSKVTLFEAQYDYGRPEDGNVAQFRIGAALVRLAHRPESGLEDGRALMSAVYAALELPPDDSESFELRTIQGRSWLRTIGKLDIDGRYESFTTLVGADEVLFISANYESKVLRDKKWLASRKEIMRQVMERVIVIETP